MQPFVPEAVWSFSEKRLGSWGPDNLPCGLAAQYICVLAVEAKTEAIQSKVVHRSLLLAIASFLDAWS